MILLTFDLRELLIIQLFTAGGTARCGPGNEYRPRSNPSHPANPTQSQPRTVEEVALRDLVRIANRRSGTARLRACVCACVRACSLLLVKRKADRSKE
jgi:hypothetical protein